MKRSTANGFARAAAPTPGKAMALGALLRQMAGELRQLGDMVSLMETSVDEMIERHAGALDASSIRNLQLLDILGQTLSALSVFSDVTATLARDDWMVDAGAATGSLKLASLARRLAGEPADHAPDEAGYEMFTES